MNKHATDIGPTYEGVQGYCLIERIDAGGHHQAGAMKGWRRVAWLVILIADMGFLPWGAMAALAPEHPPGPSSTPILTAGYEGFTNGSWQELANNSPIKAESITLLFRLYGAYNVAFGVLAITVTATVGSGAGTPAD
jgi:hypothetical protein